MKAVTNEASKKFFLRLVVTLIYPNVAKISLSGSIEDNPLYGGLILGNGTRSFAKFNSKPSNCSTIVIARLLKPRLRNVTKDTVFITRGVVGNTKEFVGIGRIGACTYR